jgi:hypothetical protein
LIKQRCAADEAAYKGKKDWKERVFRRRAKARSIQIMEGSYNSAKRKMIYLWNLFRK